MSGKENKEAPKQLQWDKTTLEAADFSVPISLILGDAEIIIAKTVREQNIDMLIMSAYAHSPLRSLLLGSKNRRPVTLSLNSDDVAAVGHILFFWATL